jgi:Fic family protein
MEPLVIPEGSRHRGELTDLSLELAARSAGFRRSLPEGVRTARAELVRAMNCYYSNLIEGHDTHPVDIERALKNDYSSDPHKRDLQLEAKSHIGVQKWIDAGGVAGRAVSEQTIRETHRRFCEGLPEDLLSVENPDTGERIRAVPGELRDREVKVGQHVAISPGAVPRFLAYYENVFSRLKKTDAILSSAAAHHRLLTLRDPCDALCW